tara:strand:+ start:30 stop:182 length:153 start_codon:yes stop_codon:yes gene_type:complete
MKSGDGESADFERFDKIDGNCAFSYRLGSSYVYASLQPDVLGRRKSLVWL